MSPILILILAGFFGACAMALVIESLHAMGYTRAEMLGAIGSLITRKEENSLPVGFLVHAVSGIIFAFIYAWLWTLFRFHTLGDLIALGVFTGFAHGLIVSFWLVILVAEHHPLRKYQRVGMKVTLAHIVGHVVYGLVVGTTLGVLEPKYNTLATVGQAVHGPRNAAF